MYLTFVYDILYFCGIYAVSGKNKRHLRKKPNNFWRGEVAAKVQVTGGFFCCFGWKNPKSMDPNPTKGVNFSVV
jgi:hypothetical protein